MLCNGASMWIWSSLAYELFINGCGTRENNILGHSFILSGSYEFTNIIIVAQKVNKHVQYNEKIVML